jgi:hypothetical protein
VGSVLSVNLADLRTIERGGEPPRRLLEAPAVPANWADWATDRAA